MRAGAGAQSKAGYVLGIPHQLLLRSPPPPPLAPLRSDSSSCEGYERQHPVYSFRSTVDSEGTLSLVVREFSKNLRYHHRTKISWPTEHDDFVGEEYAEQLQVYYTDVLVAPVRAHASLLALSPSPTMN
ncbi:hypothetical protein PM082_019344 [Marasmius tenuissimus]|nr:hypothetical protein PM082_019344 [Marasmius tenuissimus]